MSKVLPICSERTIKVVIVEARILNASMIVFKLHCLRVFPGDDLVEPVEHLDFFNSLTLWIRNDSLIKHVESHARQVVPGDAHESLS